MVPVNPDMLAKMVDSTEMVLQSLIDTLNLCGEKVKEGSLGQVMEDLEEGFSLEDFWMKLGMTFRAVSKEATKLTISFSKPPAPSVDDLQCLLTEFETSVIAMLTVFRSLPLSQGRSLHKKLQDVVTVVLEDCQELATSFLKEGCTSVTSAKTQSTGKLWEHCDALHQLPKDNKKAVMAVVQSNFDLIKDALSELEEAQKCNGYQADGDDDNDAETNKQGWSSEDKVLVPPCIGLVKVCRHCVKNIFGAIRTSGQVTSAEDIQQLDEVAEEVQKTSSNVDDVVASLYSPVNHQHLCEAASKLASQLKEMLNKTRNSHFTLESDSAWLDFLNKAVDHNLNNVTRLVQKEGQITT